MEEKKELTISRVYDAPRDLVFNAWSDATALAKWWGPKGAVITVNKLDFRPGGIFHYGMAMPNGMIMWGIFLYRDILKPEHIIFTNSFADDDGNAMRSPYHAVWPLEILNNVSFTETGGKTTLTITGYPINATDEEMDVFMANVGGMQNGFKGTLDKLDEYLAVNQ